jgi:hypothetical protein
MVELKTVIIKCVYKIYGTLFVRMMSSALDIIIILYGVYEQHQKQFKYKKKKKYNMYKIKRWSTVLKLKNKQTHLEIHYYKK